MNKTHEPTQSVIVNIALWLGTASLIMGVVETLKISDVVSSKLDFPMVGPALLLTSAVLLSYAIKSIKKSMQNPNENSKK